MKPKLTREKTRQNDKKKRMAQRWGAGCTFMWPGWHSSRSHRNISRSKGDFSANLPVLEVKHLFKPLGDQASPSPPQPAVGLLWSVWEHSGGGPS